MSEENNAATDETVVTGEASQETEAAENQPAQAAGDEATGDTVITGEKDAGESPESYADFAMPEGVELDSELLAEATPIFKEIGLSQEQAQKLVDLEAKRVQAAQQRQVDSFNQLKQDWLDQSKTDNEIGGEMFEESVADARLFLEKFGTPELKTLLNDYGVGNNPEFIRAFARAGKLLKEDSPANTGVAHSAEQKSRVDVLYPTH